jgi:hypothetical protein
MLRLLYIGVSQVCTASIIRAMSDEFTVLMMEEVSTSETSVFFYETTQRYSLSQKAVILKL